MPTPIILAKNIWLNASVNPDYEDNIFQAYRLSDGNRASKWQSTAAGSQKVVFVVPDADVVSVGAFVLDRGFTLPGATLTVIGSASPSFSNPVTVATLTTDLETDQITLVTFTPTAKKYWKIQISGVSSPPAIFNAGLYPVLDLGVNPVTPFDPELVVNVVETFETESGSVQVRRSSRKREVRARFPRMDETLYGLLIQAFDDSDENPVWWFFRPDTEPHNGVYGYIISDRDFPIVNALREGELRIREA